LARKIVVLLILFMALLISNCRTLNPNYVPIDPSKGVYERR
jgi:hypothetical protein